MPDCSHDCRTAALILRAPEWTEWLQMGLMAALCWILAESTRPKPAGGVGPATLDDLDVLFKAQKGAHSYVRALNLPPA